MPSPARWIVIGAIILTGATVTAVASSFRGDEMQCPDGDVQMMVRQVTWGVPGRAYQTLPPGLVIAPSTIDGGGYGVFAETFIRRYTWLGEYEGELLSPEHEDNISWYTWSIHRDGELMAYVDGLQLHTSSYHRFFNMPLQFSDENVIPLECYSKMYYMVSRDIVPGQELFIFYGYGYADELGIDLNEYFNVSEEYLDAGLDLNRPEQQSMVLDAGYFLYEVRDMPLSWVLLGTNSTSKTLERGMKILNNL